MTDAPAKKDDGARHDLLVGLVASKALTQFQADFIKRHWPELNGDLFAHPYLRSVPEHARAYLERASQ
jgi:hypothetical protein